MQPRRVIVYVAQVFLLAASAVSGGTAVRHRASATTLDPVTTLHVASAPQRQAGLPAGLEPGQAGNAEQVKCQPVRTHDGESHRYWLRDDAPADDRASRASDS